MSDRPLIVITLEGLATSALSCYGSSWNSTPAMDAIAATGCVWDRWIASHDQPLELLKRWMMPPGAEQDDWLGPWRKQGSIELLTDDPRVIEQQMDGQFDRSSLVDLSVMTASSEVAAEIDETQFGRLIAAAIERDADVDRDQSDPWSVLWIHSRFLSQRWDAPRELFPIAEEELMDWPSEEVELLPEPGAESALETLEDLAPIFDSVAPPSVELNPQSHPDLVNAWMRTYGCQVRLVDLLIEVLLQSLSVEDPQVVLTGTSGFSLGQNGWIGHSSGPLRSCDLRLPLVISDQGSIRSPQLTASDSFTQILKSLASDSGALISPSQWCQPHDDFDPRVTTDAIRAVKAITTSRWSFIRDLDDSDHLYLKPDDVDDANDVGRLRNDAIDRILSGDS